VDFVLQHVHTSMTQSWASGVWFNKFKIRFRTDNKHSMIFKYELAICFEIDKSVRHFPSCVFKSRKLLYP